MMKTRPDALKLKWLQGSTFCATAKATAKATRNFFISILPERRRDLCSRLEQTSHNTRQA
jgi:hypothetical protein